MIKWHSYSKESFEKAQREDKPVFLHVYADWSYFCKKIRKEILNTSEIAEIINDNFIAIEVNRDQRPDVDAIYQKASYILGQGSGWPLNLFLNHEGKPFAGLQYRNESKEYFEINIKKAVEMFRKNRETISSRAQVIVDAIKPIEVAPAEVREELLQNPEEDIVVEIDFENGGFKKTPKFPPFSHVDLLLWRYWIKPKPWVLNAIEITLNGMISGAIFDHVEGGFHRYCSDKAWQIPHFEKLAVDNAFHINMFLDGYNILRKSIYREIANQTIDYLRKNLLSQEGFFLPSQSADEFYYTWDKEELKEISPQAVTLVSSEALINGRYTLIGRDLELIRQLRDKFLMLRQRRSKPEVNNSLYCFVNAVCAEAFIRAWRLLGDRELLDKAKAAINFTISSLYKGDSLYRTTSDIPALLDDYAHMISALISLYEVTAERDYLEKAVEIIDLAFENLWDEKNGGFFDSPEPVLWIRQKSIHDTPYPSANSVMIINLVKLHALTGDQRYRNFAQFALKAFSNLASAYLTPYYLKALLYSYDLLSLNFYTSIDSPIGREALHQITPFTLIVHRETEGDYIIPSVGSKNFDPLKKPEDLSKFLIK